MARIGTAFVEISGDFGPLRRQLAEMQRGRGAIEIKVKADLDRSSFAGAEVAKKALGGKEEFKLKADLDMSSLARARAGIAVLTKESNKLGDVFNRSQLSIGQWTGILASALPVIVDMTGALGALTASAAAATTGLGALAIGMGGMAAVGFGGIAAIAAPAIKSLGDLMTAQTSLNKARSTGSAAAARSAASSAQQITAAENALANAQRSEKVAQDSLNLAREEAVRQLEDMKRAALESGTSEKRARLSLRQAEQNLRDLRKQQGVSALDIRDAELSIVEARQNVKDVSIQAQRSQEDYNKAQRDGVSKMPQVVSAQRSYDDAVRATAQANQALAQAQKESNAAAGAGATQLAALRLAQRKAGPEAVKFAQNLKELGKRWKELTAAGKTDFFGLLNDGLERTNQRLPLFAKSANESMKALREGVDAFWAKAAAGPEFKTFIRTMTDTFHKALVPIGEGFGNIVKVLERISVAVAPDLLRLFRGFDEMTQGWVDSTRNATQLREVIHGLVNQANTWWKLLKATFNLLTAVLIPGMGKGKMAIEGITASLNEWTAWVEGHPAAMRDFFKEGLETTKQLAALLLGLLPTLFQISTAMRPIARAFLAILKGLNSLKIGNVSALTVLLGAMVSAKIVKGLAGLVTSFNAVKTAALGAATAEAAAGTAGSVPLGAGNFATTATGRQIGSTAAPVVAPTGVKALVASTGGLANFAKVAGGAALAITALVGAVEALRTNFLGVRGVFVGFFNQVLKPLGDAFTELVDAATAGHAAEVFGAIGTALKAISAPLGFVIKNLTKFVGLLAIGGVTAAFATAIVVIVGPLYAAIKGITLLVRGFRWLAGTVARLAPKIFEGLKGGFADAWDWIKKLPGRIVDALQNGLKWVWDHSTAKRIADGLSAGFKDAWALIKRVFKEGIGAAQGAFRRFGGAIHDIASSVGHVFRSLYLIIKKVAEWIGNQVNKVGNALGGLKDKLPHLGIDLSIPDVNPFNGQKGMMVVPGSGTGDSVPVRAMVEPGEVLAVMNRKAAKRWMEWNEKFPRFQGGGVVDRTGVPHFAAGGYAGMQPGIVKLIKTLISRFGGYMSSGFVGRADDPGLHGRGLAGDWVGGDWTGASRFVNSIGPKLLEGIHQAPPGQNVSWDSGSQVSPSFWGASTWAQHISHIHVAIGKAIKGAIGGMAAQIGKIKIKGKGPGAEIAQGAADKMRASANKFLSKIAPAMSTDVFAKGKGVLSSAEFLAIANQAIKLTGKSNFTAAKLLALAIPESGLRVNPPPPHDVNWPDNPSMGLMQITGSNFRTYHQRGTSNNIVDALANIAASINYQQATYGGQVTHSPYKLGGILAPFLGKFHDGGFVERDGFGLLKQGETVLPQMQKGGSVAPSIPRDLIRALRHLVHFTPEDSRKERRQEARLLRRIARTDGVKQLNLISKALGKYGVDFTKAEEKRLRKLSRDQAHGGGLTDEQHRELRDLRQESRQAGGQKDIREQIEVQREMIAELKEYQRDAKERNRLLREIRANEKGGMRAVSNYIASDIGFSQRQKARQASAGNVARY